MIATLYLGGLGAITSLVLATTAAENALPLAEGTGMGSIAVLLWAVKILKSERDEAFKTLQEERKRLQSSEMKCLECDYFRYNKLLDLVLQPENTDTPRE